MAEQSQEKKMTGGERDGGLLLCLLWIKCVRGTVDKLLEQGRWAATALLRWTQNVGNEEGKKGRVESIG